jgi:hypothetical protein
MLQISALIEANPGCTPVKTVTQHTAKEQVPYVRKATVAGLNKFLKVIFRSQCAQATRFIYELPYFPPSQASGVFFSPYS